MHFIYKFKVIDNGIIFYEHLMINIMLSFDDLTILQFAFNATAVFYSIPSILKREEILRRIDTLFLLLTMKYQYEVYKYNITEMSTLINILILQ